VIGVGQPIRLPPQSRQVEHEGELAVVLATRDAGSPRRKPPRHILGYCAANDVTARDLQQRDGQWTRAKGFDTFCPLGPWIETELDPSDTLITCSVNGQMRQMGSTRDMVFSISQLLAFISSVMTLEAGDLILTGTPSGVGLLQPGDEVASRSRASAAGEPGRPRRAHRVGGRRLNGRIADACGAQADTTGRQ